MMWLVMPYKIYFQPFSPFLLTRILLTLTVYAGRTEVELSSSGLLGLAIGDFGPSVSPEAVAGAVNENVLQRRLANRNGLDFPGKCFRQFRNKAMAVLFLNSYFGVAIVAGDGGSLDIESLRNSLRQITGVTGRFNPNYVSPNLVL